MPLARSPPDEAQRDADFVKLMHGKSAEQRNSYLSMLGKNSESHRLITEDYVKHWEVDGQAKDTEEAREGRKGEYMTLVNNYYDLATDLYEEGWSQSFHLCRFAPNEPLLQALARHEHYLAHKLNLAPHSTVLDVGCGVGGPARQIATFANCNVVGVNNNSYQIQRATQHTARAGLTRRVRFVKDDFMKLESFVEGEFDAVYAIEATCHAPSLQGVYEQIYRVLKPGGRVGIYEWVMTDAYDDALPAHRAVRLGIERGNGIANMVSRATAVAAMKAVGFEMEFEEDLAVRRGEDAKAWCAPLTGEWASAGGLWDLVSCLRLTWVGRRSVEALLGGLELVGLAPPGMRRTARELDMGAAALVAGGKEGLFTPMYLMIAKKPVQKDDL